VDNLFIGDWSDVRQKVESYLGERKSPKDRSYSGRRQALATEIGVADVTLKGFLQANQALGVIPLAKLLAKEEFRELRAQFSGVQGFTIPDVFVLAEIQLELDFEGFDTKPEFRSFRLPVGKEGRIRMTIQRIS
jgi:hypothetical protein